MNEIPWRSCWSHDQLRSMLSEQYDAFWQRDTGIVREKLAEVQVAQTMQNPATRERELRALEDAITGVRAASALILTDANEAPVTVSGLPVEIRSLTEWLLEPAQAQA